VETELWAVGLIFLATIIGALGSLCFKLGAEKFGLSVRGLIENRVLLAGFFFYGFSSMLFIVALKGGELSVLYPLVASTHIWVCLLSIRVLGERMNLFKWLGVLFIVVGVGFIGLGAST